MEVYSQEKKRHRLIDRLNTMGTDIILTLRDEAKKLDDLRRSIDARDTSILHTMKDLESEKMVFKDPVTRLYALTNIGHIYASIFDQLFSASETLKEMEDFWLHHDLSGIPRHLLMEIGNLREVSTVKVSPSDLNGIHRRYLESLKNAVRIDGVSPVFHPDFVEVIAERLNDGAKVRLVVTREILNKIKEEVELKEIAKYVKRIFIDRNLEVYVRENLKVGLTVTERFLSLGLFMFDEYYDYSSDLMSSQPQALDWGRKLFEHYRGIGERVKFLSLL